MSMHRSRSVGRLLTLSIIAFMVAETIAVIRFIGASDARDLA